MPPLLAAGFLTLGLYFGVRFAFTLKPHHLAIYLLLMCTVLASLEPFPHA